MPKLLRTCLLPALLSASLLSGCTAVTDEAYETLKYAFASTPDAQLTDEQIEQFPYTALYAQWEGESRILMVLGYADAGELSWVTAENETVITRHGRVIRTAGVNTELLATSNQQADPLRCIVADSACPESWSRSIDIEYNGRKYSRQIESVFIIKGQENITLPVGERHVTRVEEIGYIGRHQFTNIFWLEADGHVVKSRQHIIPERQLLELTQVKWVGRS